MNVYVGLVEDNKDPNRVGRLKIRVMGVFDQIPSEDIPWASPLKESDGKSFFVPAVGKLVSVIFINDNMYSPYYIDAENYNHNLNIRLKDMDDDDYVNFTSLLYDHRTQIYSNNEELKLDYYYNNIVIDKGSINLDLKNNKQKINLGDRDTSSQQALFGNHWLEWFDKVVNELLLPVSLIGNMGAPIIKIKLDALLQEYKIIRQTFLSNNIYLVDNGDIAKQNKYNNRDYETKIITHDVDLKYNDIDILDTTKGIFETTHVGTKGDFTKKTTEFADTQPIRDKIIENSIEESKKSIEAEKVDFNEMEDNILLDEMHLYLEGGVDPDPDNSKYFTFSMNNMIHEDGTPITGITEEKPKDTDITIKSNVMETFKTEQQKLNQTNSLTGTDPSIYYHKGSPYTSKSSSTSLWPNISGRNLNVKIEDYGLNIIRSHQLGRHKYRESDSPKNKIFLHHTNGNGNPLNDFNGWNKKDNLISTPFMIGGYERTAKSWKYNGEVYQYYPDNAWSWTSRVGGEKKEKYIISIEICNYGYLYKKDGKWVTSYKNVISDEHICNLQDSPYEMKEFRGYTRYQKYYPEQIEALRKLLEYLIKKHNIKIEEGIYHKPEYWKYKKDAFDINSSGIFHHAHTVVEGKWDMSPQPLLIDMLNGLKNAI